MKKLLLALATISIGFTLLAETSFSSTDVPEAKNFKIVYEINPLESKGHEVTYSIDNSNDISRKIKRVAYFLEIIKKDDSKEFVFVALDPFTQDIKKIGVPTKDSGARFQTYVSNLEIYSNVNNLKTGKFWQGNIEFWDSNYSGENNANIPGATDKFDFGDRITAESPGYGSMQVHNTQEKQTIFAYNKWRDASNCDLGIGNSPYTQPDWTFSSSAKNYKSAKLSVLVELE